MFEIGATLREARERRQLTWEQVEADTKIRAKYLRALEEEEFDSLPSGTYVRGFLRAYASYLGLDGRLFVDEYASRFGTRHDDELFRRRRERPMTQRRESSSAVLVALIAVVAIGVLFFVAWRFGPGEGPTPQPLVVTTTQTVPRNGNLAATTAPTVAATDTTARRSTPQRQPVHLRVDVSPDHETTWVKITRLSTGKPIAQKRVPPGGHLGGGNLQDADGFAIESGIPGNVMLAVNGRTFSLNGTGPVWVVTADSAAVHVEPAAKVPPAAVKEQP
ncbi:MAG TPA: helix-turn-helix domain-containing protein [Gaiellales bacterium]|jgi:cytoskeletal protein RodZ|nr:helix-turn-helix domain-containing protein [Gaiellales bacterium]